MDIKAFTLQVVRASDLLYRRDPTSVVAFRNDSDEVIMVYVCVDGRLVAEETLPPRSGAMLLHPHASRLAVYRPGMGMGALQTSRQRLGLEVIVVPCQMAEKPEERLPPVQSSSGHATCCILRPAERWLEPQFDGCIVHQFKLYVDEPELARDAYTDPSKGDEQSTLLPA